jgi:hypothetical protein
MPGGWGPCECLGASVICVLSTFWLVFMQFGDRTSAVDTVVSLLRLWLVEKYCDITGYRTDNIEDVMKSIIDT